MRRKWLIVLGLFLAALVSLSSLSWSQTVLNSKVIEGAKKEGQVVWYSTMTLDQSKVVVDHFQKKYPFIKPELFRTGGGPLLNKILTEARDDLYA